MDPKVTKIQVVEYVRYFEAGDSMLLPGTTSGKTFEELAERARKSIVVYFDTFKRVEGLATVHGKRMLVRSEDFDFSDIYYIDAEVVPIEEVPESERRLPIFVRTGVIKPKFGIKDRFGNWCFEDKEPRVINLNPTSKVLV